MKSKDPFMSSAELEWDPDVDLEALAADLIERLSKLAVLIDKRDEADLVAGAEEVLQELYLLKHYLSRYRFVIGGGEYAIQGIAEVVYRLTCLDQELDRYIDKEINSLIFDIVAFARKYLRVSGGSGYNK